jgi:L-ascorbate metabolism protein UlaG (beta-lactamase superfamily)
MLRYALPVLFLPLTAAAQERIPSHCQAIAAAEAQVVPATFGAPLEDDSVRLRFVDHAMWLIETPGGMRAVTDYTGFIGAPDVVPDVVTMNNAHATHWTPNPDPRIPHVLRGWGDGTGPAVHALDLGEMLVRNVTTDIRPRLGGQVRAEENSIFIFEVAGLCIGHLGHLHQVPTDEDFISIGRLDVVMVPVDGGYTMPVSDMAQVVSRLRSSVVLPMHWFSGASLDEFLRDMEAQFRVVRLDQPDIELSLDLLPSEPTIIVLKPAFLE